MAPRIGTLLMTLDITIEDNRWQESGIDVLAAEAIDAVLAHFALAVEDCEISLLACGDARISELNAEFREKPMPTNVLSWPADDLAAAEDGEAPGFPEADFTGEIPLGDIAISYDTCAREAAEGGKTLTDHTRHLVIHGMLHLFGYDHIRDRDAALMEGLEVLLLGKLGVANPYRDEDAL